MQFEFATAGRVLFGAGRSSELGAIAATLGTKALVVVGSTPERIAHLLDNLNQKNIDTQLFSIPSEPTTDIVQQGVEVARETGRDVVVSIGGGSVLDAGKAIAALLSNGGEPLDYLEVIGKGLKIGRAAAPHIAIPTTSGTGTEVTRNAVLAAPQYKRKVSMRSPYLLPSVALVDPSLTHSTPPHVTAQSGLDALAQVIEPYVSHLSNPITDSLCREGIFLAAVSLPQVYEEPDNAEARSDMALASLLGGFALANAKLGAVHGFAGPIGGQYGAPHGAIVGRLLPYVVEANVEALKQREPESEILERYDEVAKVCLGNYDADVLHLIDWLEELCENMDVPTLRAMGVSASDFDSIVEASQQSSSMKGNPIQLTDAELRQILVNAF